MAVESKSPKDSLVGVLASNPHTGECFYASRDEPNGEEMAELMASGALFKCRSLREVSKLFLSKQLSDQVVATGKCIARYMDRDIPEWVQTADGVTHDFFGVFGKRKVAVQTSSRPVHGGRFGLWAAARLRNHGQ